MSNKIHPYLQSDLIEVDITGVHDGPMEADRSMAAFLPASKIPVSKREGPLADERCIRSDHPRFQTCNGGDNFEDRPGRVLPLNPFVLEGGMRLLHKGFQLFR